MTIRVNAGNSPYAIILKTANTQELPLEDVYVYADSSLGPVSILLPLTSDFKVQNVRIFVQDTGGAAATHNITLLTSGSNTLNGASSVVIDTANGFARCKIGAPGLWTSVGSSTGGGGGTGYTEITPQQTVNGQQAYLNILGFSGGIIRQLFLDGSLLGPMVAGEWTYDSGRDTLTFNSITITSEMWIQGLYSTR